MSLLETPWAHVGSLQGSLSPDLGSFLSLIRKSAALGFQSGRCFESGLNQPCCCRTCTACGSLTNLSAPLAGADLSSVDPVRGKTALEWAVLTDSFDTAQKIRQLLRRPQAEQLSLRYRPEWPALAQLVAQAQAQAPAAPSLLERLQATLSLSFAQSPQEGGVLDHLVTVTTSLVSPFLSTACHTLCPDHPPKLGTRGKSVPELLGTTPLPPPEPHPPQEVTVPQVFAPYQSPQSMFSQWLQSRDSTSTRSQVPKILLSKAPSPSAQYELILRPQGQQRLAPPVWRFQERKKKEEETEP